MFLVLLLAWVCFPAVFGVGFVVATNVVGQGADSCAGAVEGTEMASVNSF